MKDFFKDLVQDKAITLSLFFNGFFMLITIIFILFTYWSLPPFVPIFNQLPWGDKRLGTTFTIFIPVFCAILIFAINSIASAAIYKKIPLVSRMLAAVSLLASILSGLFVARTIILIL